jgi:hypothetical protein
MMAMANNSTRFAAEQTQQHSQEELVLSSFAALLSAAQLNGLSSTPSQPQEHHYALRQMITSSCWPHVPAMCTFPSMSLKRSSSATSQPRGQHSHNPLKNVAADNLALPMELSLTNDDVQNVPMRLLHNVVESLVSLIKSRIKSSSFALLRQTQKGGAVNKQALLMTRILMPGNRRSSTPPPVKVTTAVTSFRIMPLNEEGKRVADASLRRDGVLVLPVMFEAVLDFSVFDSKMVTIPIQAPGTLSGKVCYASNLLQQVELALDNTVLLNSLMYQARGLVKQVVTAAASLAHSRMQLYKLAKIMAANNETEAFKRSRSSNDMLTHRQLYPVKGTYSSASNQDGRPLQNDDWTDEKVEPTSLKQEEPEEVSFAMPRTMSDLSEYQAEDSCPSGKSAKNLLVDLNRMDDKNGEGDTLDEVPRFRIGDLFSIMSQEIALKTQGGQQGPSGIQNALSSSKLSCLSMMSQEIALKAHGQHQAPSGDMQNSLSSLRLPCYSTNDALSKKRKRVSFLAGISPFG